MPTEIQIDGTPYPLPDSFTLGELFDVERRFGGGIEALGSATRTLALLWVALVRSGSEPEEASSYLRALDMSKVALLENGADPSPPVEAPEGASDSEMTPDVSGDQSSGESTV